MSQFTFSSLRNIHFVSLCALKCYFIMSRIEDKVLHSFDESPPTFKADGTKSVVDIILDCVRKNLDTYGDQILIRQAENVDRREDLHTHLGM